MLTITLLLLYTCSHGSYTASYKFNDFNKAKLKQTTAVKIITVNDGNICHLKDTEMNVWYVRGGPDR